MAFPIQVSLRKTNLHVTNYLQVGWDRGQGTGALELTGLLHDDLGAGLAGHGAVGLDGLDHVHTLGDLAEDDVLAVEPWAWDGGDEELGAIRVGPGVRHGEQAGLFVLLYKVLVLELVAVDGTAAVAVGQIGVTTLEHEVGDDTVEGNTLVAEALLTGAQGLEVGRGLGDDVVVELELDSWLFGAVDGGVEEDLGAELGGGAGKHTRLTDGGEHGRCAWGVRCEAWGVGRGAKRMDDQLFIRVGVGTCTVM